MDLEEVDVDEQDTPKKKKKKKQPEKKDKIAKRFSYGCKPPIRNKEAVEHQMWLAHKFKNECIAVVRKAWEDRAALIEMYGGEEYDARLEFKKELAEQLKEARAELKLIKKAQRSRNVHAPEITAEILRLEEAFKAAKEEVAGLKSKVFDRPEYQDAVKALREEVKETMVGLKNQWNVPLHWSVRHAVRAATNTAGNSNVFKGKKPPRFKRWDRNGHLFIELQDKLTLKEAFACESDELRIEPVPPQAWDESLTRAEQRRLRRTHIWIRTGAISSETSERVWTMGLKEAVPEWVVLPMTMHRPIPERARIGGVSIVRTHAARGYEWAVQLVVVLGEKDDPNVGTWESDGDRAAGAVAMDVGWRQVEGGLRVAYWYDGRNHGEIILPQEILDKLQHSESLQAVRKTRFNEVLESLKAWLKGRAVPEWMAESTQAIHSWKSQRRLAALYFKWRDAEELPEDDDEIFAEVEAWWEEDSKRWREEAYGRKKACAQRREFYRTVAADFARNYKHVIWEKLNLAQIAKRCMPEKSDKELTRKARHQRVDAALSIFRDAMSNAMFGRGGEVLAVAAAYTTSTCHVCGSVNYFDSPGDKILTCNHCSATWDRDENAARNIYASGMEAIKEQEVLAKEKTLASQALEVCTVAA